MNIICNECRNIIDHADPKIIVEGDLAFCDAKCKLAYDEDVALFNQQQQAFIIFSAGTEGFYDACTPLYPHTTILDYVV
jgi:hypothetical protein